MTTKPIVLSVPMFGKRDPDERGYYGLYGGSYVPETLVAPIEELVVSYEEARKDPKFISRLQKFVNRVRRSSNSVD